MSAVELLKTKFLADSGPSLSDVPRILTVLTDGKDIEDLRGAIREVSSVSILVLNTIVSCPRVTWRVAHGAIYVRNWFNIVSSLSLARGIFQIGAAIMWKKL